MLEQELWKIQPPQADTKKCSLRCKSRWTEKEQFMKHT